MRSMRNDRIFLGLLALLTLVFLVLYVVDTAFAQVPGPGDPSSQPDGPVATGVNLYLLVLGAAVPLVGYVLNHHAPWASEPVKQAAQIALAAAVAVLYQAVTPGDLGLNDGTLLAVLTAVVSALLAHFGLYKPSGVSVALGAGTNAPRR